MTERLRQWKNDAGTVLVDSWDDGAVQIKERPDQYAAWGPPRTLRAAVQRDDELTPDELGTLLACMYAHPAATDPTILPLLNSARDKLLALHGAA